MTNYKFVQSVSMQVNQEQFDYLNPKLESLGYDVGFISNWHDFNILVTNYSGSNEVISNVDEKHKNRNNRHFIDHYNPELFIAIAAMTDAEYGIAGEHWVYVKGSNSDFSNGKIYSAVKDLSKESAFIGDRGFSAGNAPFNLKYFRRATLAELINHYTKLKTDMSTETRNVAFTLEQAKALYEKDKEQYAWLLPTFPELEQPKPITWEGLYDVHGFFIDGNSEIHPYNGKARYKNKSTYRTEAQARGALAQSMITQLLPVYNNNKPFNWKDGSEKFHLALLNEEWFVLPTSMTCYNELNFHDNETAERFLTEQTELLEQYKGLFIEPKKD